MRGFLAVIAATGVLVALTAPAVAARQPGPPVTAPVLPGGKVVLPPPGPNPYLALVPDPSVIDHAAWARYGQAKSAERAGQRRLAATGSTVDEAEPPGSQGGNDSITTAQRVATFGTGAGQTSRLRLVGTLTTAEVTAVPVAPNPEDDGSIRRAGPSGVGTLRAAVTVSTMLGNGPHGSARSGSGDFDVYAVDALAGKDLIVDVDTPRSDLDSMVTVYDATGVEVAFNDDADDLDSRVAYTVPTSGRYFVSVAGYPSHQSDPFVSGSGTGAGSEGRYDVTLSLAGRDVDVYAVRLRNGDVLGASVTGAASALAVHDTTGSEVMGSRWDRTFSYSARTPLPGGGNAVVEHVADRSGWHYLAISAGRGGYDATVEVYRARLDTERPPQTLYLDLDGQRLNTAIWGGSGVRTLSPLGAFLPAWGLSSGDLDPLIDQIVATVRENLYRDMVARGGNPDFQVTVKNSRDHADVVGNPNVSRVIVGGTIAESGIDTIGIAQSVDPGNFDTEESAVVLLDVLSGPPGPFGDPSLNSYIAPTSDRVAFVGRAIGNIVSHEAGHFFGDWHVDESNDAANLMDQGGNFPLLYGVGADGVGGSADDTDVDFGEDDLDEGFTGRQDTLTRVALALTR